MNSIWHQNYEVVGPRVLWSFLAVTAVVVGLRLFCRLYSSRQRHPAGLGLDDYITVFCFLLSLVVCILVTIAAGYGLGKHVNDLDTSSMTLALKYNVIINSILIWQFSLPKFALIATLKRILNYGTRTAILFWTLGLSSQACIFATSVWWFKQCTPVESQWDQSIEGTCADVSVITDLGYFTSAYSAFLDVFFAFYPIPFVMRLNMPLKNRIAVAIALSLSSLAFVVSVIKLVLFGQVFAMLRHDPTYPLPYLDILAMSEGFILIICSSLPTLGPLFRAVKGKLSSYRSSMDNSGGNVHSSVHSWRRSFGHAKPQRLTEEIERTAGLDTSSSTEDIPLHTSSTSLSLSSSNTGPHRTVDFSSAMETMSPGLHPPPRIPRAF
ncbi:hypothetical protein F4779DRAFT_609567 [Xylariaceae sp. FL0662B]|nr:hypothetical protein F4779DRAFT_609567 [Xylariaceae sp. FL0662B]